MAEDRGDVFPAPEAARASVERMWERMEAAWALHFRTVINAERVAAERRAPPPSLGPIT